MSRIFVQMASYHDGQCQATVGDLFAKAAYPDTISVGVCRFVDRYDEDILAPIGISTNQLRIERHLDNNGRSLTWAKTAAAQLWQGEEFVLAAAAHMRFAPGWDIELLQQYHECPSPKPVLSFHPPGYILPNVLTIGARPAPVTLHDFTKESGPKFIPRPLDFFPLKPLHTIFASTAFYFASASILCDILADPLFFEGYETLSFGARLFTHGYDVYVPRTIVAYLYDEQESIRQGHKRPYRIDTEDIPVTEATHQKALARLHDLVQGVIEDEEASRGLEFFALGQERSYEEFEVFSGFRFNENSLASLPPNPDSHIDSDSQEPDEIITFPDAVLQKNKPVFSLSNMTFSSRSILADAPTGILIMQKYLSSSACKSMIAYAESRSSSELGVIDFDQNTSRLSKSRFDPHRITQHVAIDGMAYECVNLFNDIFCHRVAPFFQVNIEAYERPQILRYSAGGMYNRHADACNWDPQQNRWVRLYQRDYSVILYLNDDYEGGALEFFYQKYRLKPKRGMLVAFPSDQRFIHAATMTTAGLRYAVVSWARIVDSPPAELAYNVAHIAIGQRI